MYRLNKEDMDKIAPFFQDWNETLIWSCLQGHMGNAWVDDKNNPKSAQIITGDLCFFAGKPDNELVENIPPEFPSQCIYMIPQNEKWESLIEYVHQNNCHKFMRYAFKKEPGIFDTERLKAFIRKLPPQYKISRIDEDVYNKARSEEWSRDLCSQFSTYDAYEKYGLGFVVMHDDKIVSGASSYTVYDDGIEIEIDTKKEYRRKGLALICASKLILECLGKGLYPSWDAANRESVALAEKLGYNFEKEYVTFEVTNFRV